MKPNQPAVKPPTLVQRWIHGVDRLDADADTLKGLEAVPGTVEPFRFDLNDPRIYKNVQKGRTVSALNGYAYVYVVPKNRLTIITGFSISNAAGTARAAVLIYPADKPDTVFQSASGTVAHKNGAASDALEHIYPKPLVLHEREYLGGIDTTWAAGNTLTYDLRYVEVEVR